VSRLATAVVLACLGLAVAAWVTVSGSVSGASAQPDRPPVVLYTIGVSTDHYGKSSPRGFGVVVDLGAAAAKRRELRSVDLHGAEWIGRDQILVPRSAPPFRPPLLFRLQGRALIRTGPSPLPALDTQQEWSPDGRLVASKQIEPCEPNQRPRWRCYRQADEIYLQAADGSGRRVITKGSLDSWMPDGRLIVTAGGPHRYVVFDPRSRRVTVPLSPRRVASAAGVTRVSLGPPRWSADGRYVAAMVAGKWPKSANVFHALVIARADGTPVRVVTSPYVISMFAWSPRGHRLAWTTSGFPTPHELFVLDDPNGQPRRLFVADRHFDWITWSPEGRKLLLDDENARRWLLITTAGRTSVEKHARHGGRPYWCCPVNAYSRFND
jgi:dipeptidyl aminopeptidase/acylaminoacyl peptidase